MARRTSLTTPREGQSWNLLRANPRTTCARVAGICATLGACAAGYWRLDQDAERLVQLAFVPGVGLDPEVSRQFATATATVPLSQTSLGIVAAALTGQPTVSRVAELPANSGSGRWLRAFGADRSVAVPLSDSRGSVHGVFSVALPEDCQLDDHEVVESIREVEVAMINSRSGRRKADSASARFDQGDPRYWHLRIAPLSPSRACRSFAPQRPVGP